MNLTRVMPAEGFERQAFSKTPVPQSQPPHRSMERSMRFLTFLAAATIAAAALPATAADRTLTVYTYDAFTSEWGPGPAIKKAFEKDCGCTLEYVALDSRSEEPTSELPSLMRISYAVFCLTKKTKPDTRRPPSSS